MQRLFISLLIALVCASTAYAQRMYDGSGRQVGRVDGERYYDGSGHQIGRVDGSNIYDGSGRQLDRIDGERVYNSSGSKLGVSMVNVFTVDLACKWAVLMANESMTDQVVK